VLYRPPRKGPPPNCMLSKGREREKSGTAALRLSKEKEIVGGRRMPYRPPTKKLHVLTDDLHSRGEKEKEKKKKGRLDDLVRSGKSGLENSSVLAFDDRPRRRKGGTGLPLTLRRRKRKSFARAEGEKGKKNQRGLYDSWSSL